MKRWHKLDPRDIENQQIYCKTWLKAFSRYAHRNRIPESVQGALSITHDLWSK